MTAAGPASLPPRSVAAHFLGAVVCMAGFAALHDTNAEETGRMFALLSETGAGAAFGFVAVALRRAIPTTLTRRHILFLLAVGGLGTAVPLLLSYETARYGFAFESLLLVATSFVTALLSVLLKLETRPMRSLAAASIGASGCLVVIATLSGQAFVPKGDDWLLLALAIPVLVAARTIFLAKWASHAFDPWVLSFGVLATAWFGLMFLSDLAFPGALGAGFRPNGLFGLAILLAGACLASGTTMFFIVIRHGGPTYAGLASLPTVLVLSIPSAHAAGWLLATAGIAIAVALAYGSTATSEQAASDAPAVRS